MQRMMGENFKPDQIDPKQFEQIVLDDLIKQITLQKYSEKEGYAATDAQLVEAVKAIGGFQENGKFSPARYREAPASEGYSTASFESEMRNELAIDQMRAGIVETAFATDADLSARYRLSAQERSLSYAVLAAARFESEVNPTDEQIKARYDSRKAQLLTP